VAAQEKIVGILWNCCTNNGTNKNKFLELDGIKLLSTLLPTSNEKLKRNVEGVIHLCTTTEETPKELKHVVYEVSTFFRKDL